MAGGLLVGHFFQVAEHDRLAIPFGEPVDLLVQNRVAIVPRCARQTPRAGQLGCLSFPIASSRGIGFELQRDAARDAMKPSPRAPLTRSEPALRASRRNDGLKSIIGVVRVSKNAPADRHDHRPVPLHEGLKSQFVAVRDEPFQKLSIG